MGILAAFLIVALVTFFVYKAASKKDPTKVDRISEKGKTEKTVTTSEEDSKNLFEKQVSDGEDIVTVTVTTADTVSATSASTTAETKTSTAKTTTTTKSTTKKTGSSAANAETDDEKLQKLADAVNDAAADYNNAKNTLNDAIYELDRANEVLAEKEDELANSESKVHFFDNREDRYAQGSFAFFEYVGADDALDVLNNAKYASSTVRGDSKDATSLENMKAAFKHIRRCNELRRAEGLSELQVSDMLMAIAQSDLNESDRTRDHTYQYSIVEENLSWNYDDPFVAWYDEEKAGKEAHYMNIINGEYQYTGFAVCTAGRNGEFNISHSQVFGVPGIDYGTLYTVDEYESRFNDYYDKVTGKKSAEDGVSEEAQSAVDSAKQTAADRQADVDAAQKTADEKWESYVNKVNEYTAAGGIM